MADSVQPLAEFLQNLVEDLRSGAISPQEALAASTQYTYLRETLVNNYSQLAQAATTSDDALKSTLQNVLTQLINRLNNLPSFQNQSPDDPLSEEEVRSIGALRQAAAENIKVESEKKLAPLKDKRRAFIHELVGKFSSTMPAGAPSEEVIGKSVDHALSTAAQEATSTQTKERFSELLVAAAAVTGATPITKDVSEKLIKEIESSIDTNTEYITEVKKVIQSERETYTTLFTHPETARPDVLVDILLHAPPTEKKEDVIVRALKLADVASSLDAHKGPLPPSKNFFHAGNAKGAAKGAQRAADGILSLLGEPLREIILKEKINGTLRNMFTNTQGMIDRLGENFVRSSVFAQILQNLTRSLNDKPTTSQARGVFDDVFSSVFKGPLNNFTAGGTKEQLLNFFELARANANAPANQKFLPSEATPWNFILDKRQRVLQQRAGGLLGWLPAIGLGRLGNWASDMFTASFDRSTSFIFSGSRIPNQMSSSRRAASVPTPLLQDLPLLTAIVVTVTIVLLFVVQSPLNSSLLNYSSKVSSLLASLANGQTIDGGFPIGTIGKATLTCAKIDGVHIYQTDPRWAFQTCSNVRPEIPACLAPTACTIGASGCGSASATMILNAFGVNTDVSTVWSTQHQQNGYAYYTKSCASFWSGPIGILTDAGLSVSQIGITEITKVLEACGLVLAVVDEKWNLGQPTGHIIVITGISQEGGTIKVTTLDPMRPAGYTSTVTDNPTSPGDIRIRGLFGVVK